MSKSKSSREKLLLKEYLLSEKNYLSNLLCYFKSLRKCKKGMLLIKGFLRQRIEAEAPLQSEKWQDVFKDIEKIIFDGSLHWLSSNNFGYYPAGFSYPAMLGDILSAALSQIGFTWVSF